MTADAPDTTTVVEVVRTLDTEHPPVLEVAEALADARELPIATAQTAVYDAIDAGVLEEAGEGVRGLRVAEDPREPAAAADCDDETPTPDTPETTTQGGDTGVTREDAVAALRDTLEFYHRKVDESIDDHAGDGDHPERPDTAREYFTDVRGWDDTTVDELLLGWAPPDHVDELVAHLHRRGHSREAMLATGAIGERDSGSLYTTFSGRYVLPYFDSSGEPAYAIARVTGGEGGGAKGYGGHPADGFPGKYAKLRHTDDRVPFAEPIYGLDTLGDADHVVVAEGIADAITARALGYAVLSPVTRQFKEEHYPPLVDALKAHGVDRVTVVADADARYNADAEVEDTETIAQAVGRALETVGAGLDGALRTAANLRERADAVDVRVTVPPAPGDLENDLDDYVTAWGGDLGALLRSARPARQFDAYDTVVDATPDGELVRGTAGERPDTFDPDEYDPSASSASETTDDIRDVYHALDHLDARRVARRTITREVLADRGDKQTIAPSWAPAGYDGTAVFVDRDKFVDTGGRGGRGGPAAMAAIDAGLIADTQAPEAVEGETWIKAVDHLRDLGFEIPELDDGDGDDEGEEYRRDPREVDATVDPRRAWDAAGRVTPADLDEPLPQLEDAPDVVRAVAIAEGLVDAGEPVAADTWRVAYATARDEYGAPLPEYYTTADAVAEFDAVLDLLGEVTFFDLGEDAIASTVTAEGDEVDGDAVRALDPAWRESDSGESVLVFDSGTVWDADSERVVDAVRFAALEAGAIDDPTEAVEGEAFTAAYQRLRTEYGAPLPRWEPAEDGAREVTPQLPPAEQLVDAGGLDGVDTDELDAARGEVETLLREATAEAVGPTVVRALPATGKTTGTIKTARDRPLSYLAPRLELQEQALEKAERWGVDARVLPVLSERRIDEEVLASAVAHVRDEGTGRLRDRWAVFSEAVDEALKEDDAENLAPSDIFVEDDNEDDVDLDRATCPTAEGENGPAWALAVHVARRLGYSPRQIHQDARGLFGAELPCADGEECRYSQGWENARDPDDTPDLLVGSYGHAHVESVRSAYERLPDGTTQAQPRAVVLDEYPGEAFVAEYGPEALDFATWLATALREDVDDRVDLLEADLWGDEFVRAWLDGEGEEYLGDAIDELDRAAKLREAADAAEEILEQVDPDPLEGLDARDPLGRVTDAPAEAYQDLRVALERPERGLEGLAAWVEEAVVDPLAQATDGGDTVPGVDAIDTDALPVCGDLAALVKEAVEYVTEGRDGAQKALTAAGDALKGGADGTERLAAWAADGYAHPDAHHFLEAVAAPTGEGDTAGRRVRTDKWAFDPQATDGTVVDVVDTGDRARTVVDRNQHGALLDTPPARTAANGEEAPVVGLDATGRPELWREVVHEPVEVRDIHDTAAERRRFLREALDLTVVQAADRPRPYSGDPAGKDTDGDAALLEALAEEYTGVEAPRTRDDDPAPVGRPAAITTKGVRQVLKGDPRLEDTVGGWAHFGDLKGANDLAEHRLAAVLGSQHYGDDAVERFAALAGEEVDTSRVGGRGAALEYGGIGDTYLAHMREDQVMQAVLRFARGGSGATVVARTAALRDDLPVDGRGQVVETWSDTATEIARRWRALGERFTVADVADAVDVSNRQVRRVLDELVEAGYADKTETGEGLANEYEGLEQPPAGEVELPDRDEAVACGSPPGHDPYGDTYTWNVRVRGGETAVPPPREPTPTRARGAPPAPTAEVAVEPPD
jgi:hypothetical protein